MITAKEANIKSKDNVTHLIETKAHIQEQILRAAEKGKFHTTVEITEAYYISYGKYIEKYLIYLGYDVFFGEPGPDVPGSMIKLSYRTLYISWFNVD